MMVDEKLPLPVSKVDGQKKMQKDARALLQKEREHRLPVYVGDVEDMLQKVSMQMPMVDTEAIFLMELDTQQKVFLAFILIGAIAFLFGVLI